MFRRTQEQDSSWSWLICFSAALSIGSSLGFAFSFGVVFPVLMEHFNESRGTTACVGSVGISMAYIACPITGMSVQRWGCRFTAMVGALVCAIGLLASSFVQKMFFLYFTYSLLFGLGVNCIFMACYIVVARNFEKRRSLATGFVASGVALGVLVIAPIKQILLDSIGWRIIYRMMAAAFAGVFFLAAAVFTEPKTWNANENHLKTEPRRKNRQPLKRNKLLDLSVCKVPEFVIITLSVAVECFGLYIPQIHLVKHSESLHISDTQASNLFIFFGLASFLGRILSGRLCDVQRIESVRVYQLSDLVTGIAAVILPSCTSYTHLIICISFYGFGEGMSITSGTVVLMSCVNPSKRSSAFGLAAMCWGLTAACGPPLAGFIADKSGSYVPSFYLAGGTMIIAAFLPFFLSLIKQNNVDCREQSHVLQLNLSDSEMKENCELIVERETVL